MYRNARHDDVVIIAIVEPTHLNPHTDSRVDIQCSNGGRSYLIDVVIVNTSAPYYKRTKLKPQAALSRAASMKVAKTQTHSIAERLHIDTVCYVDTRRVS